MLYKELSDENLMSQVVSGNDAAFNEICTRYNQMIYTYIFRHVRNVQDAEDLTQNTFKSLYEKASSYDQKKGTFKTFTFRIARNAAYHHLREQGKLSKRVFSEEESHDITDFVDPSRIMENKELTKKVLNILDLLPRKERDVVHLRLNGLELEEIANVLKTSYYAVKAASSRGFFSLREKLRGLGYGRE